jgi:hypothetical protein
MKDTKETKGRFHRIYREKGGNYGIETLVVEKGKIVEVENIEPNYPTITLAKFGKKSFEEANETYDKATK